MSSVFGEGRPFDIYSSHLAGASDSTLSKDSQRLGMIIAKDPKIAVEKPQYWMEENLLSVSSSIRCQSSSQIHVRLHPS